MCAATLEVRHLTSRTVNCNCSSRLICFIANHDDVRSRTQTDDADDAVLACGGGQFLGRTRRGVTLLEMRAGRHDDKAQSVCVLIKSRSIIVIT